MVRSRPCWQAVQKSRGKTLPSRFKATMVVKITWESWFFKNWREIFGFQNPRISWNLNPVTRIGMSDLIRKGFYRISHSAAEWLFGFIVQIGKASEQQLYLHMTYAHKCRADDRHRVPSFTWEIGSLSLCCLEFIPIHVSDPATREVQGVRCQTIPKDPDDRRCNSRMDVLCKHRDIQSVPSLLWVYVVAWMISLINSEILRKLHYEGRPAQLQAFIFCGLDVLYVFKK